MGMAHAYSDIEPSRADIDAMSGAAVIEFGTSWCGICRATQPAIAAALAKHPDVRHLKIQDGSGRPLGRSFDVKLWPTLIFLREGTEITRLVRPRNAQAIDDALERISGT